MRIIKKIILILFTAYLYLEILQANEILLKKNKIIITNIDLKNYKNLHNDYHGHEISNSSAIKKLYMIFKIVNKQISANPKFIKVTNNIIKKDVEKFKEIYSENIISYFLRYEILKNDFINLHIDNNGLDDFDKLDELFKNEVNISSDADCKYITQTISFKELTTNQKKSVLTNVANKSILIDKNSYLCLSQKNKEKIYYLTKEILTKQGNEKFLNYVYKNIK